MDIEQSMRDYIQFSNLDNFLISLIENFPYSGHLKDAQTGKYLHSNYYDIKSLGLESVDDLLGLTAKDLLAEDGLWKPNLGAGIMVWRRREIKMVEALDYQVRSTKRPLGNQSVYCKVNGLIRWGKMIKLPILDRQNKKSVAILTFVQNITFQFSLFKLFALYREYYPETKAIRLLLKFLKIDAYFIEPPTVKEMEILFAMRRDPRHKCVAKLLNFPLGTVGCYIQKLRDKSTIGLSSLLAHLRAIPVDGRKAREEYPAE